MMDQYERDMASYGATSQNAVYEHELNLAREAASHNEL